MTLGTASPLRKTNHPVVVEVKVYNRNSQREYYETPGSVDYSPALIRSPCPVKPVFDSSGGLGETSTTCSHLQSRMYQLWLFLAIYHPCCTTFPIYLTFISGCSQSM
jgi:hypothetical protein